MKKIFLISTAVALASFIMAGITYGIFGRRYRDSYNNYAEYYVDKSSSRMSIFSDYVYPDSDWHINNEFPNITVYSAGANINIVTTDEDMIHITANYSNDEQGDWDDEIAVTAEYEDESLYIAVCPYGLDIDDFNDDDFGSVIVDFLQMFRSESGITVTIEIPEQLLESFTLKQDVGTTNISGIKTENSYFEIVSGSVNCDFGSGNVQNQFCFDISTGTVNITNAAADWYDIDIGSANYTIKGLSGQGYIDVGNGSGTVYYAELNDDVQFDIGNGNLDIYLPNDSKALVQADIGIGTVSIDACGTKDNLPNWDYIHYDYDYDDYDDHYGDPYSILIGTSRYDGNYPQIDIDIGNGNVNIYDYETDSEQSDNLAELIPSDDTDELVESDIESIVEVPDNAEAAELSEVA